MSEVLKAESYTTDLEALVLRIRAGDLSAEAEFVLCVERGLHCILYRRLGRGDDTEDLCQEILMAVLAQVRAGKPDEPRRISGYIQSICRRMIADAIRTRIVGRSTAPLGEDAAAYTYSPETEVDRDRRLLIAEAMLQKLTSHQREVLTRYYLQEQSEEQMCREMNLGQRQVRDLRRAAVDRVKALMRRRSTTHAFRRVADGRASTGQKGDQRT